MADTKYPRQLSLAIETSGLSKRSISKKSFLSESSIGKYALGQRSVDHEKKKSLWSLLKGVRLGLSSARADFGTISFMNNPRINEDAFAATTTADQEESERKAIWTDFKNAIKVPEEKRTRQQQETITTGFKELVEEIASEQTELIELAEYGGIDPQPFIDKFNQTFGG